MADSLALVLAEAGIAGLPLVSTDVGAISELVRPEETGLLVPPGDDVALVAALDRLVSDPALRHSLGANAQRVVREDFNAAKNASRVVDLLVDVASETLKSGLEPRITTAGTPPTSVFGGTERVTTAPAATTAPSPMVTPLKMTTRAPIQAPSPMVIGSAKEGPARCQLCPTSWLAVSIATS